MRPLTAREVSGPRLMVTGLRAIHRAARRHESPPLISERGTSMRISHRFYCLATLAAFLIALPFGKEGGSQEQPV